MAYSQVKGFETPGGSFRDGAQTPALAYPPTPGAGSALLPDNDTGYAYNGKRSSAAASNKKKWIVGGVLAAIVVLIIVIAVPVAVTRNNSAGNSQNDSAGGGDDDDGGSGGGGSDNNPLSKVAQTGGNGSMITMENGQQFQYINSE